MPRSASPRTRTVRPKSVAIPSDLQAAALILEAIRRQGLVDQVDRDLSLVRRKGHTGNSLLAFAVVFLASGPTWGIRRFCSRLRGGVGRAFAAIAGVRSLPSQATISRMLAALPPGRARASVDALLRGPKGMRSLLSSPHVLHRDACGGAWHVVDIDPTVTAFRQRALPSGPEFPDAVRIAPGEPGYTGQYRGEFRVRDVPILHSGAGLWLGIRRMVTEGSTATLAGELVGLARAALKDTPSGARMIARFDGEFGSVGAMRATIDAGAEVLTRLSRYTLLDGEEAAAVLAGSAWYPVKSGGSGPPREAAELGRHLLKPSHGAAGSGKPVTVRVVVTRIPRAAPPEHGILRGGYQYELFATTLEAEAWPAEAVITLFFGRAGLENRFAQEDREFALYRTFCHEAAGQEWMVGVGLFLWNFLVCKGVELDPLPARADRQPKRATEPEPQPAPAPAPAADANPPAPIATTPPAPSSATPNAAPATPSAPPTAPTAAPSTPPAPSRPTKPKTTTAEAALWAITCDVFADVAKQKDWSFDHGRRRLFCPNKMPFLHLSTQAQPLPRTRSVIRMSPGKSACVACPLRATCLRPTRPGAAQPTAMKVIGRSVSHALSARVTELMRERDHEPKRELRDDGPLAPLPPPSYLPPPPRVVGDRIPTSPLFLPAESRASARHALNNARVEFRLFASRARPRRRHSLLARDEAHRQHRRATWTERRSARSNPDRIEIVLIPGAKAVQFRKLLGV